MGNQIIYRIFIQKKKKKIINRIFSTKKKKKKNLEKTCPTVFYFGKSKGMFGNCFFLLFSIFKNNFLILKEKNMFGNPKWTINKNCSQNSICEGNRKHAEGCFQFLVFES